MADVGERVYFRDEVRNGDNKMVALLSGTVITVHHYYESLKVTDVKLHMIECEDGFQGTIEVSSKDTQNIYRSQIVDTENQSN